MIGILRNNRAVLVHELHRIVDVFEGIGCLIGSVTGAVYNFLIPSGKGIGIGVVRCLGGIFRNNDLITIVIGILRNNRAVIVHEFYCVICVFHGISCGVGHIRRTGSNLPIPPGEGIHTDLVRRLGGIFRNNDLITIVIGILRNDRAVLVHELYRVIRYKYRICLQVFRQGGWKLVRDAVTVDIPTLEFRAGGKEFRHEGCCRCLYHITQFHRLHGNDHVVGIEGSQIPFVLVVYGVSVVPSVRKIRVRIFIQINGYVLYTKHSIRGQIIRILQDNMIGNIMGEPLVQTILFRDGQFGGNCMRIVGIEDSHFHYRSSLNRNVLQFRSIESTAHKFSTFRDSNAVQITSRKCHDSNIPDAITHSHIAQIRASIECLITDNLHRIGQIEVFHGASI